MTSPAFAAPLQVSLRLSRQRLLTSPLATHWQCRAMRAVPTASLAVEAQVLPRLRELSAATRRGRSAGTVERDEAESLVARLEAVPAAPPLLPASIAALDGVWHLIFLVSGAARLARSNFQTATIRAADDDAQSRNVTQTISVKDMRAVNSAAFSVLGVPCEVSVDAKLNPIDEYTVEVVFQTTRIKIGFLPVIPFPVSLFNARGTLRTTYLSEECRIGRGNKGSLFVLVKQL